MADAINIAHQTTDILQFIIRQIKPQFNSIFKSIKLEHSLHIAKAAFLYKDRKTRYWKGLLVFMKYFKIKLVS